MWCINYESLLINALIELREKNIFRISMKQFIDYVIMVIHQYENEEICQNRNIKIGFNQNKIEYFVNANSDVLGMKSDGDQIYIYLKEQVNISNLKEQFCWTLSYKMLKVINKVDIKNIL